MHNLYICYHIELTVKQKNHYLVICKHRKEAKIELQISETIRIPPPSPPSPLPPFSSFLHVSNLVI